MQYCLHPTLSARELQVSSHFLSRPYCLSIKVFALYFHSSTRSIVYCRPIQVIVALRHRHPKRLQFPSPVIAFPFHPRDEPYSHHYSKNRHTSARDVPIISASNTAKRLSCNLSQCKPFPRSSLRIFPAMHFSNVFAAIYNAVRRRWYINRLGLEHGTRPIYFLYCVDRWLEEF